MNWTNIKNSIGHAFKVADGEGEVTEEDHALLDKLASFVVKRRMTAPALLFLETVRPLNFVGSSIMTFFRPTLGWLFRKDEYKRLENLLEKRCSLELLINTIEKTEDQQITDKSNKDKD